MRRPIDGDEVGLERGKVDDTKLAAEELSNKHDHEVNPATGM